MEEPIHDQSREAWRMDNSALQSEIEAHSNGAQFRRADLHVHSFGGGGSYDVTDSNMTPENIVDTALTENLQVIAISDHNRIDNVPIALEHANNSDILVVPSVELSTAQGHLLVYFPTFDKLQQFYGRLSFSEDRKQCQHTIPQCLQDAETFDGFGICAHIDTGNGLEDSLSSYDQFKQDIINCKNLLALEIVYPESASWFSHDDELPARRECAIKRCRHLDIDEETDLAKVMSSDAHSLSVLGRNARGDKRLTRVKMESLTFNSLRIALLHSSARVRLEDLIPPTIPHFVGMRLEGGFLNGQTVHFSPNLTCIIGGRGAGKTTMLESLRAASGNEVKNSILDSQAWPDTISLIYEDEVGCRHTLCRNKLQPTVNIEPEGPSRIAIESYGQGETADTIQHCDENPEALLRFLDGFIELTEYRTKDETIRTALLENQSEIERLQLELNQIPEIEKLKKVADAKVATLRRQKAKDVVDLEQKLAKERTFREKLIQQLTDLLATIDEHLSSDELKTLASDSDRSTLAVGKPEFEEVMKLVTGLVSNLESLAENFKKNLRGSIEKINIQFEIWVRKERDTQTRIENIRRDLEKSGIELDMGFIRKVTTDASFYAGKLVELKKAGPKQQAAHKVRRELLSDRRALKSRVFILRQAFAKAMNQNLARTVVDYQVTIRFRQGLLSADAERIIKEEMEWRTSRVPKATLIASQVSATELLDAIGAKKTSVLTNIKDESGNQVFTSGESRAILDRLGEWGAVTAFERCLFEDFPTITVTRSVVSDGETKAQIRDFSQLSLGQQQSILLSVLLFSESQTPLVIDQPEDNLDSEFIYKTLVRTLRTTKEKRQVIIVTHNANIAVLGDAELIIPLRGASERAVIRDRGSIDTPETKDIACTILEGSKIAFKRRRDIYGF